MKRLTLSLLLCVCLAVAGCLPSLADEPTTFASREEVIAKIMEKRGYRTHHLNGRWTDEYVDVYRRIHHMYRQIERVHQPGFQRSQAVDANRYQTFMRINLEYCNQQSYERTTNDLNGLINNQLELLRSEGENLALVTGIFNDLHAEIMSAVEADVPVGGNAAAAGLAAPVLAEHILFAAKPGTFTGVPVIDGVAVAVPNLINLMSEVYNVSTILSNKDEALELLRLKLEYERNVLPAIREQKARYEAILAYGRENWNPDACDENRCISVQDRIERERLQMQQIRFERERARQEADVARGRQQIMEAIRNNEFWELPEAPTANQGGAAPQDSR